MPEGEYIERRMPDFSKSKLKTLFFFCAYLFYVTKILGEKQHTDKKCDVGTDTHLIFSEFWKYVDAEYIFNPKKIELDPTVPKEDNPLTHYFYGICMSITPDYDREVAVLQRIFWKFAVLQSVRFYYFYKLFNRNRHKIWHYFFPIAIEDFYYAKLVACHGTIDIIFRECDDKLNEYEFVADFKTGNIPIDVLRGPKNLADDTSTKLPPRFMFEIHVYGLLRALKRGCTFLDERVIRFVLDDEWQDKGGNWHKYELGKTKEEQQALDKTKRNYLTRIGASLDKWNPLENKWEKYDYSKIIIGLIFLSGNPDIRNPVVVKKKFNVRSMRSVLRKINTARQVYFNRKNDKYYLVRLMKTRPEYSKYRCDNCSRNDKCLQEIEEEFRRGL